MVLVVTESNFCGSSGTEQFVIVLEVVIGVKLDGCAGRNAGYVDD